jgi:DNA polymerase I-like protein with 3'-5' exonuclease and polymerase domains
MQTIKVNYKSTTNATIANRWLRSLPDFFAADFEVAVKYLPEELEQFALQKEQSTSKREQITLQSKLKATPLGHPSHCQLTHLSIAWSPSDSFVLVLDNPAITNIALRFLTTTPKKQIWHNAGYDFRQMMYFSGHVPLNYEDTQILAKCLMNHVESYKADTKLKSLMGNQYGSWGISADHFTLAQMYDDTNIRYAATDACATYKLWLDLQDYNKQIGSI